VRRFLDREVVGRGVDAFLAVSTEDRRRMIEIEGVDPKIVRFVPNGIRPLECRGVDVRAQLHIDGHAQVIGTVGVLRRQKALDVLVQATRILAPRFPALKVLIAGAGPEESALRSLIAELGLEHRVLLLGIRRDVADLLAALDVAVCCSRFEGSPLSVMEYMAAAKPVVATRVGGVPDLVEHGAHGLLVEPGEPAALAEAIAELLADTDRATEMGARGRDRQRAEFDVGVSVARIEELYEELFLSTNRAKRERWAPRPAAAGLPRLPDPEAAP
jgi:glycosyltransferase involved in cell wall biosynthesis